MKQEVIYVPVKVEYELPPNNSKVLAGGDYGDYRMTNGFHIKKNNCTHWLKPVQSVYVLTEDELNKIKMGNAIAYHDWYKKNEHGLNTLINGRKATSEETYNLFIKSHNSTPKP